MILVRVVQRACDDSVSQVKRSVASSSRRDKSPARGPHLEAAASLELQQVFDATASLLGAHLDERLFDEPIARWFNLADKDLFSGDSQRTLLDILTTPFPQIWQELSHDTLSVMILLAALKRFGDFVKRSSAQYTGHDSGIDAKGPAQFRDSLDQSAPAEIPSSTVEVTSSATVRTTASEPQPEPTPPEEMGNTLVSGVLSGKENTALKLLGITTISEFLELDLRRVLTLRGYGERTVSLLRASQTELRCRLGIGKCQDTPNGDVELHTNIAELPLSVRGRKALRRLNVNTVREFLAMDLTQPLDLPNCGETTYRELVAKQTMIASRLTPEGLLRHDAPLKSPTADEAMERRRQAARSAFTEKNVRLLPLFCGERLDATTPEELHESYHAGTAIGDLFLNGRVLNVLQRAEIHFLGDLLLRSCRELLGNWKCGIGTLMKVQEGVLLFLKDSGEARSVTGVDSTSPEAFIRSMIGPLVRNERQQAVLVQRLAVDGTRRTLEELGKAYHLTRERVRQIEKAAMRKLLTWGGRRALSPFHDFVVSLLRERGPMVSCRFIARALQRAHGWETTVHAKTIEGLLQVFPDLKCIGRKLVSEHDFRCTDCQTLPSLLEQVLQQGTQPRRPLRVVAEDLAAVAAMRCDSCTCMPHRPSQTLVRYAYGRSLLAQTAFHLNRKEVWTVEEWRLAKGSLSEAINEVLRAESQALSYKEVYRRLRHIRRKPVSQARVWTALRASTQQGDILLWDRGGLYRHKHHVNLYAPVINTVEKWVVQTLPKLPVPQMSAYAAFVKFRKECVAAGIVSEYAIHSCLKHRQHPKLSFYHSPYLGLAGAYRIPNVEIVEELLRQEGDIFPKDKLESLICGQLGLKSYQFTQVMDQLDNVIRTENGFLYADYFDQESPDFKALVAYAALRAAKDGEVSAQLLYKDKVVSCLQLRIDGPRMLYYLLESFAPDRIQTAGYPIVLRKASTDATEIHGVRERVIQFIRQKREPVSCDEIRLRFVKKLGFRHNTVFGAMASDAIVRYLNGFLVHIDTLEWNPQKEKELRKIAEAYYDAQVSAGGSFARVDHLLEIHESSLPVLGNGVAWTPTLLATMLSRDAATPVVGPMENAYVLNKNRIAVRTFGDFVRVILTNHFEGAASMLELSQWLRDERAIKKTVTPYMVRGDGLIIEGHTIRVRRSDEC